MGAPDGDGRESGSSPIPAFAASGSGRGSAAVGDAVLDALAGLGSGAPELVLVFPSGGLEPSVAALQAREAAGRVPVAGMSSNGAVAASADGGPHCSALALGGGVAAGVGVAEHASRDARWAGRTAAEAACASVDLAAGHPLLLLFIDPAAGDQGDVVAGAYEATGPTVPFAGGGAGAPDGVLFAHGTARRDGVVAVVLVSPRPLGVGISHACSPLGIPSIVTRAAARTVLQLDGRPADEVYLERLGRDGGAALDDAAFAALAVVHPLAQPELSGDVRLRHVFGRAPDGGLACATPIPANAAVAFTEQTPEGIVDSAGLAVERALEPLDGAPARAALVFDCAGRQEALGEALPRELAMISAGLGEDVPLAGGFTRGEVGRVRGAKGDRNHALVVVAFG